VVVNAMSDKGQHVGSVETTLGISETQSHGVSNNISTQKAGVNPGESYIVELYSNHGPNGIEKIDEFEGKIANSQNRMTLKNDIVNSHDVIEPGRSIKLKFYEIDPVSDFTDNSKVIDRCSAILDTSNSDNISSSLASEKVHSWLDGQTKQLKFRNTRNQKEAVGRSSPNKTRNGFTFAIDVREEIDANSGDLIEIISAEQEQDKEVDEMISEMHSMMMEMYNDYVESKE